MTNKIIELHYNEACGYYHSVPNSNQLNFKPIISYLKGFLVFFFVSQKVNAATNTAIQTGKTPVWTIFENIYTSNLYYSNIYYSKISIFPKIPPLIPLPCTKKPFRTIPIFLFRKIQKKPVQFLQFPKFIQKETVGIFIEPVNSMNYNIESWEFLTHEMKIGFLFILLPILFLLIRQKRKIKKINKRRILEVRGGGSEKLQELIEFIQRKKKYKVPFSILLSIWSISITLGQKYLIPWLLQKWERKEREKALAKTLEKEQNYIRQIAKFLFNFSSPRPYLLFLLFLIFLYLYLNPTSRNESSKWIFKMIQSIIGNTTIQFQKLTSLLEKNDVRKTEEFQNNIKYERNRLGKAESKLQGQQTEIQNLKEQIHQKELNAAVNSEHFKSCKNDLTQTRQELYQKEIIGKECQLEKYAIQKTYEEQLKEIGDTKSYLTDGTSLEKKYQQNLMEAKRKLIQISVPEVPETVKKEIQRDVEKKHVQSSVGKKKNSIQKIFNFLADI